MLNGPKGKNLPPQNAVYWLPALLFARTFLKQSRPGSRVFGPGAPELFARAGRLLMGNIKNVGRAGPLQLLLNYPAAWQYGATCV
jgi:hypothetical protein